MGNKTKPQKQEALGQGHAVSNAGIRIDCKSEGCRDSFFGLYLNQDYCSDVFGSQCLSSFFCLL